LLLSNEGRRIFLRSLKNVLSLDKDTEVRVEKVLGRIPYSKNFEARPSVLSVTFSEITFYGLDFFKFIG